MGLMSAAGVVQGKTFYAGDSVTIPQGYGQGFSVRIRF